MKREVVSSVIAGGSHEAVAAVGFWAECVRREHHGYKWCSRPDLFGAIDALQPAASQRNWRRLLRQARLVRDQFRTDEYAYAPRLRVWRPNKNQVCLSMSPAFYKVGHTDYSGDICFQVTIWTDGLWHCEVSWSAIKTPRGAFPNYAALQNIPDLHWQSLPHPSPESPVLLWPNTCIPFDALSSEYPI